MYSGEHAGELPSSLALLNGNGYFSDGKVYGCPSRPDHAISSCASDYIYVGSGLVDGIDTPERTPLLYDKDYNHGHKWINVGFADDHVEGVKAVDFASLAQEQGWIVVGEARKAAQLAREARD
jgi:hypothetical protein